MHLCIENPHLEWRWCPWKTISSPKQATQYWLEVYKHEAQGTAFSTSPHTLSSLLVASHLPPVRSYFFSQWWDNTRKPLGSSTVQDRRGLPTPAVVLLGNRAGQKCCLSPHTSGKAPDWRHHSIRSLRFELRHGGCLIHWKEIPGFLPHASLVG